MKTKSTICLPRSRRAGLTLIEVVAAIAILGTVLVGVVMAKARHTHQLALTERRNDALRAADELLASWWTEPQGVPVAQSGEFEAGVPLAWETRWVPNRAVEELGARVLRVEIRESPDGAIEPIDGGEALVVVDLVMPNPDADGEKGGGRP